MADDELKVVQSQPLPAGNNDPYRGLSQATSLRAAGPGDEPTPVMDFAADVTQGAGKAALKTAGGLTVLASKALHKIPGVGETLAPEAGTRGLEGWLQKETAPDPTAGKGERIGEMGEETAEWIGGDEALKALGKLGKVAKNAPELLQLAEKFPTVTKLLLGAAKGATLGGAQAGVKAEATGQDPAEAAVSGAKGGAAGGVLGEVASTAAGSKLAQSWVNKSLGTTARDVLYGNPAKALFDEGIINPRTGDVAVFQDALQKGVPFDQAMAQAGGRMAAVHKAINEITPQLEAELKASTNRISVKKAILDPLYQATSDIIKNRAMTEAEKDAAIDKLIELQKSLIDGLGKDISPLEANEIKQQIGDRINWGGTTAVTDEVKPVYRTLYGSLKQEVHKAVPTAERDDARLTNLLAAWSELNPRKPGSLGARELTGKGPGVVSGNFWDVPQRMLDELGRIIPVVHKVAASPVTKATLGVAGEDAGMALLPPKQKGHVRFRASDGSIHDVPQEHLDKAAEIDPELKVLD